MTTLTVTAKGQVTLKQDLLRHLGIRPGQKINVDTLPDGRAVIQAAPEGRDIADAFGILAVNNPHGIILTIDEINEIAQAGWSGDK
ncbi:AbrB/MazE/SpoVT family DNA-binding domain-containing protein [Pollutimonas bauzanensis]|uniref:AbrB/MazE/SpoVT family DNA-binding domain-containing protein n=1 Tax=Pollutimonas bauzanensis TaxID=658167 RepID=UPI0009355FB3|nr:AbrB/MazE/SpoVT family DNA-binding domain-containing protein [Pollutimonas bauzanensis]